MTINTRFISANLWILNLCRSLIPIEVSWKLSGIYVEVLQNRLSTPALTRKHSTKASVQSAIKTIDSDLCPIGNCSTVLSVSRGLSTSFLSIAYDPLKLIYDELTLFPLSTNTHTRIYQNISR